MLATFVYPSAVLPFEAELKFDPSQATSTFFNVRPVSARGIFLIETRQLGVPRPPGLIWRAPPICAEPPSGCCERPDPASKRLNLREVAADFRYRVTGSRFEQSLALYQHARARFPRRYRDLLRLRPSALLKVNLRNAYPRCYVTRRILSDGGFYFGPFPSRRTAECFCQPLSRSLQDSPLPDQNPPRSQFSRLHLL